MWVFRYLRCCGENALCVVTSSIRVRRWGTEAGMLYAILTIFKRFFTTRGLSCSHAKAMAGGQKVSPVQPDNLPAGRQVRYNAYLQETLVSSG